MTLRIITGKCEKSTGDDELSTLSVVGFETHGQSHPEDRHIGPTVAPQ